MFTNRCLGSLVVVYKLMPNFGLRNQHIEFLHVLCFSEKASSCVSRPSAVSMCVNRFADYDMSHLRAIGVWSGCVYTFIDVGILHLGVFVASATRIRNVSTVL